MTVSFMQTDDHKRLYVAFQDENTGPVEGYVYGDLDGYIPYRLDDLPLAVEKIANPVDAAKLVIDNYKQREIDFIDRNIASLRASADGATGLTARLIPKRIESALAYRAKVLAE